MLRRRARLKPASAKRRRALDEYFRLRSEYLKANPRCHMGGCRKRATQVHHKAGRGPNLNRTETWMAVCFGCHADIHANPNQSRKDGYLL